MSPAGWANVFCAVFGGSVAAYVTWAVSHNPVAALVAFGVAALIVAVGVAPCQLSSQISQEEEQ